MAPRETTTATTEVLVSASKPQLSKYSDSQNGHEKHWHIRGRQQRAVKRTTNSSYMTDRELDDGCRLRDEVVHAWSATTAATESSPQSRAQELLR